ncbi:MAG: hypothetical protein RIS29_1890 [Bacteroidota bacterium]|jgi:hypothetical protein
MRYGIEGVIIVRNSVGTNQSLCWRNCVETMCTSSNKIPTLKNIIQFRDDVHIVSTVGTRGLQKIN